MGSTKTRAEFLSDPMSGGVDSRRPPNALPPSRSPDLLNVTLERDAVSKRGGFVPHITDTVPGIGVKNAGFHSKSQLADEVDPVGNPPDVAVLEAINAPGKMVAAHRDVYGDLRDGFTLDFFCSPDDLTEKWVANGGDEHPDNPFSVEAPNLTGGYQIYIRPILSKGFVKKTLSKSTDYTHNEFGPKMELGIIDHRGAMHWNNVSAFGPEPESFEIISIAGGPPTWTVTTSRPHGMPNGESVKMIATGNDGVYVIAGVTATTFQVTSGGVFTNIGVAIREPQSNDEKQYGCPFAVYLKWNVGSSEFNFAFGYHHINGANFNLEEIIDTVTPVELGAKYHILASYTTTGLSLFRVGIWDDETQKYRYNQTTAGGANHVLCNPTTGPVQVFDISDRYTNTPAAVVAWWDAVNHRSIPPGLGLNYFTNSVAFEGTIHDIAIHSTPLVIGIGTEELLDRVATLDPATTTDLISYWPMEQTAERYCLERTGVGNHMYLAPDTPILDEDAASLREGKGAYWFNGETSYAFVKTAASPNWDSAEIQYHNDPTSIAAAAADRTGQAYGALSTAVRRATTGTGFGLAMAFRCDSIEPFEQVIAELHGLMRVTIRPDGRIACYTRDDVAMSAPGSWQPAYNLPAVAPNPIEIGRRYHVVGWKAGATTRVYIDKVLAATITVDSISNITTPMQGFTIGAGARLHHASFTDVLAPHFPKSTEHNSDSVNTDGRSHFLGHIESVGVLVGSITEVESHSDLHRDLAFTETSKLWDLHGNAVPADLVPANADDRPLLGTGRSASIPSHRNAGFVVTYQIVDQSAGDIAPGHLALEDGGTSHNTIVGAPAMRVDVAHYLCLYGFFEPDLDRVTVGRWDKNIEQRTNNITTYDVSRPVYEFDHGLGDFMGQVGGVLMRCVQPGRMSESLTGVGSALYSSNAVQLRNRPYLFRAPRELAPRFSEGLGVARSGTNGITALQDWAHGPTGKQFLIAANERCAYLLRRLWEADSPYPEDSNPLSASTFGGRRGFIVVNTVNPHRNQFEIQQPGGPAWTTVTLDFWVKPLELSGTRILAFKGTTGSVGLQTANYVVYLKNGSLGIAGDATGGSWVYEEGTMDASPTVTTDELLHSSVKKGQWNHIHVHIGAHAAGGGSGGTPGVFAWVNGNPVLLTVYTNTGLPFTGQAIGAVTPLSAPTGPLYIGGLPNGVSKLLLTDGTIANYDLITQSFQGEITEFKQSNVEDPDFLGVAAGKPGAGKVPQARHVAAADAFILLHLNQSKGRIVVNDSTVAAEADAFVEFSECLLIGDGIASTPGARFSTAVYRDRVYMTNGVERPLEIGYNGALNAFKGPFEMRPMGMAVAKRPNKVTITAIHAPKASLGTSKDQTGLLTQYLHPAALMSYWMSFVDNDGRESEPVLLGSFTPGQLFETETVTTLTRNPLATGDNNVMDIAIVPLLWTTGIKYTVKISGASPTDWNGVWAGEAIAGNVLRVIRDTDWTANVTPGTVETFYDAALIEGLPRLESHPHVRHRKFYVSTFGGGNPVFHSQQFFDERSNSVELWAWGGVFGPTADALVTNRRLPPPRAKILAVGSGNGAVFLAHLTGVANGPNAMAWSDQLEPTYFPFVTTAVIDSENGRAIVGAGSHKGSFFIFKRDSTWLFGLRGVSTSGDVGALLRVINQSVGLGAGLVIYDDRFYGAGERGVHAFDGANQVYISKALEGLWTQPLLDVDLLDAEGAFHRDGSLYLCSFRKERGDLGNKTVFVLHTNIINDEGERPFSVWEVPEHTSMRTVVDPQTQRPVVLLGATSGRVLRYDTTQSVDGIEDVDDVAGSVADTDLTSTTIDVKTSTVQRDLHGATITLRYTDPADNEIVVERVVEHHERTAVSVTTGVSTISWLEPLTVLAKGGTNVLFEVGGFDAHWSSAWFGSGDIGAFLRATELDVEFLPAASTLTIDNAAAVVPDTPGVATKPDRVFPTTGIETRAESLLNGFFPEAIPISEASHGRFVRARIGTYKAKGSGARSPFTVSKLAFRATTEQRR